MGASYLGEIQPTTYYPLPLFTESVSAGFPSPAQDYVERQLDLNELCIRHPSATYMVRVQGDSMIDAGIYPGDTLVVDRSITPLHGHIVIAEIHGELTVKRLELTPRTRLLPCNSLYPAIEFSDGEELCLMGVVLHSIRNHGLG